MSDDEDVNVRFPMSSPSITDDDIEAVSEVLQSGRLALGPKGDAFGQAIANRVGADHGVAVSSGTAALHTAIRGLGLGEGDEVLVPSYTFAATVNALLFEDVRPRFVDIDPHTLTMDPTHAEQVLTADTTGILPVDVFGHPAEWGPLLELAEEEGLVVIDDAAEALGAHYRGQPVGSFGDAAIFAFYPNKQITTGEGGVLVTGDQELASRARSLRNQGRGDSGEWLDHERLGYNYRIDEMSAALGLAQLDRLDELLKTRERLARAYTHALEDVPGIDPPQTSDDAERSWFVYPILLDHASVRDALIADLSKMGIPTRAYFPPVHLQPHIRERFGTGPGDLPTTEDVASRVLCLPFGPHLEPEDARDVAQTVETVGKKHGIGEDL